VTYRVIIAPPARRQLARIPESVAAAVFEFMSGPLADRPHRVGKPLEGELAGRFGARRGEYRIVYRIVDETVTVTMVRVAHRRNAYRP
jgi:mRNA interferase RelE/StbE